jgi:hypothetical protein
MITRKLTRPLRAAVLVAAMVVLTPAAAYATAGTATITGGSLVLTPPATVSFNATLDGTDQNVTAPQALDVWDDTGTAAGWNMTATSTTFTAGDHSLSNTSVTIPTTPTVAFDAGGAGSLAVTNISYPYTLPAAPVAPTATKMLNATAGTGSGHQTATATMQLAVPRQTFAGVYTSTWTYSLVSGP